MTNGKYSAFIKRSKNSFEYRLAKVQNHFALRIETLMKEKGFKQKDLANEISAKPAYVSRILRGDTNVSIKTMLKLAEALDAEVHLNLMPKNDEKIHWGGLNRTPKKSVRQSVISSWSNMERKAS
ncbi:MAG: helix-turn-helix transcriptional regulator [Cycloclasticus sp.]|jgi:Helix-turn-helix.